MTEERKKGKGERVVVHVRVRPFNQQDPRNRDSPIDTIQPNKGLIILRKEHDKKTYVFDTAFGTDARQNQIFQKVGAPVVQSVLRGYNGTIFAYGQTGTGKTHTMIGGSGEQKGIIPRSVQTIFQHIKADNSHSFTVQIGFLQLYMEMLQDLLNPEGKKNIKIRESPDQGVYLTGMTWVPVKSVKNCMDLMYAGDRNRNTAFTKMNSHSSRSHAVYMVRVQRRVKYSIQQLEQIQKKGDVPDQSMTKSVLYLVDLAGSERVKKSRAAGSRLDQAKNINLALLALGNCIQALADKKQRFVPFRDSKLTRLLQDSLGGNSKTSLIVTIGPSVSNLQQTISSLQFGSRAMKVVNRPQINKKVDYRALCVQLQAELDRINDGNNEGMLQKQGYLTEIAELQAQLEKVITQKEELEALVEEMRKSTGADIDLQAFQAKRKADLQKLQQHYKRRVEKQEAEHKKFLQEIDVLMLEQEQDINFMKSQIQELKQTKIELEGELARSQEELEKEREDRENYAGQLSKELENLREKHNLDKEELGQNRIRLKQFNEKIKEKERKIEELNDQLHFARSQHHQEIATLEKQVLILRKGKQENKVKIKSKVQKLFEDIKIQHQAQIDAINIENQKQNNTLSEIQNQHQSKINKINYEYQQRLEQNNISNDRNQKQLQHKHQNQLKLLTQNHQNQINQLKHIQHELNKQLKQITQNFQQKQVKIGQLNDQLHFARSEHDQEITILKQKLQSLKKEQEQKKIKTKKKQQKQLEQINYHHQSQISSINQGFQHQLVTASTYNDKTLKLVQDNYESKIKLISDTHQAQISILKQTQAQLKTDLKQLNQKLQQKDRKIQEITDELTFSRSQHHQQNSRLEQKNKELLKKVQEEKVKNQQKINQKIEQMKIQHQAQQKKIIQDYQQELISAYSQNEEKLKKQKINYQNKIKITTQLHQSEIRNLNQTHKKTLEETNNNHSQFVSKLKSEFSSLINQSQNQYQDQLFQLTETHNHQLQSLKAQKNKQIQQLKQNYTQQIQSKEASLTEQNNSLSVDLNQQIEQLKVEHVRRIIQLKTSNQTAMASLKEQYQKQIQSLNKEKLELKEEKQFEILEKNKLTEKLKGKKRDIQTKVNAAVLIQRFYRAKKKKQMKKQAYIAEYVRFMQKYQRAQQERGNLSQTLNQVNSKTGQFLVRTHFKDVSAMFTSICRKFSKPTDELFQ